MQIVAIADDLSGAAEATIALGIAGSKIWLYSNSDKDLLNQMQNPQDLVIDADIRRHSDQDARLRIKEVQQVISNNHLDHIVYYKIDSLLRGHVDEIVRAAVQTGPTVVAMANPATGRATINGIVNVQGVPLHEGTHWSQEAKSVPTSIQVALHGSDSELVTLQIVRSTPENLFAQLNRITAAGKVAICDSENEDDLLAIAQASIKINGIRVVGSAGIAKQVGKFLNRNSNQVNLDIPKSSGIAVVIGSQAAESLKQVEFLKKELPIEGVSLSTGEKLNLENEALILSGGETARTVLDHLGIHWISPKMELETGVTVSTTSDGRVVVIKPGSYGDHEALLKIIKYLSHKPEEARSK